MKFKKVLSVFLSAVIMVTAILSCGITTGAESKRKLTAEIFELTGALMISTPLTQIEKDAINFIQSNDGKMKFGDVDLNQKDEKGTDYTVSCKNNKNIGTATVTIKDKGKYTGSKTLTFKIVPKKTTLTVKKSSSTKAKFSWDKVSGAEKYQIYYSKDGGKTYKRLATISGSKTSCSISKLDFKKYDYKFKIRSYKKVDSKTYYSSYSKSVTVK